MQNRAIRDVQKGLIKEHYILAIRHLRALVRFPITYLILFRVDSRWRSVCIPDPR